MLLETGFLGLLALACLGVVLARLGASVLRAHWVGLALVATLVSFFLLGFFVPILMQRVPGAVLWLLAGLAAAHAADRARSAQV